MNNLLTEFKPVSSDDWKAQIKKDLKGTEAEQLIRKDEDGILIKPFYHSDNNQSSSHFFSGNSWQIVQSLPYGTGNFNANALESLNSGADSLFIKNYSGENHSALFGNISLEHIHTFYEINNCDSLNSISHWGSGTIPCFDPLISFTQNENYNFSEWNKFRSIVSKKGADVLFVDACHFHECGATPVIEISNCISQLCEQLNQADCGSPKEIWIAVSCGEKIFHEIAKLRALRSLLGFVVNEFGLKAEVKLYVKTAANMLSAKDFSSNYLRKTFAAFAAVCGNCNALEIQVLDDNNNTFHRLGRNLQLVLREEAFLDKVSDPASGAYFVEALTNEMIEKGYSSFQSIEKSGGLIKNRANILNTLNQSRNNKVTNLSEGKEFQVGVNKFLNEKEVYIEVNKVFRFADELFELKGEKK